MRVSFGLSDINQAAFYSEFSSWDSSDLYQAPKKIIANSSDLCLR